MSDSPAFDRISLMERLDDDYELLEELTEIFDEDAQSHIDALREAVAKGDAEAIEKTAHSLKGSSANMSAQRLADLALKLERAGRENRLEGAGETVDLLETEYRRVVEDLRHFLTE